MWNKQNQVTILKSVVVVVVVVVVHNNCCCSQHLILFQSSRLKSTVLDLVLFMLNFVGQSTRTHMKICFANAIKH